MEKSEPIKEIKELIPPIEEHEETHFKGEKLFAKIGFKIRLLKYVFLILAAFCIFKILSSYNIENYFLSFIIALAGYSICLIGLAIVSCIFDIRFAAISTMYILKEQSEKEQ
tara:strand:+ start:455 stop:790 length:336 start_codon:yes stop_codon:yes gene_type:complete